MVDLGRSERDLGARDDLGWWYVRHRRLLSRMSSKKSVMKRRGWMDTLIGCVKMELKGEEGETWLFILRQVRSTSEDRMVKIHWEVRSKASPVTVFTGKINWQNFTSNHYIR